MTRLGLVGDPRRSDAQAGQEPDREPSGSEPDDARDIRESLSRLAGALSAHSEALLSPDLALDLLLNQIVEQARLATNTTGAAIALRRGHDIVCRATTGATAPDLGVRLNTISGLSAACVRSMQVQICDDTETDPRVDPVACRRLGVRSILIVPVLNQQELLGVFEIFSPRPSAFGDRDVQTLHALSQRAVESIRRSTEALSPRRSTPSVEVVAATLRSRDPWTLILTVLVVALAVLLGWLLGHEGWQRTLHSMTTKSPQPPTTISPPASPTPPDNSPAGLALPPSPPMKSAPEGASPGGLVVYQNGKVIFRAKPQPQSGEEPASGGNLRTDEVSEAPTQLPPQIAEKYLMQRVEPVYPEAAREEHIQGQVLLDAIIGKDGTVQELKAISGDPQLAAAAADAVRQWHFLPFLKAGQPAEFQTQITVDFKLP